MRNRASKKSSCPPSMTTSGMLPPQIPNDEINERVEEEQLDRSQYSSVDYSNEKSNNRRTSSHSSQRYDYFDE